MTTTLLMSACTTIETLDTAVFGAETTPELHAQAAGDPHARWLRVRGDIQEGYSERVIRLMREEHAEGLILESRGGSLHEGRQLGRYLRRHGKRTGTDGLCASACVDVLAGGVDRFITENARLGVHQSALPGALDSRENRSLLQLAQASYLVDMGVDHAWAFRVARRPREDMVWLSPRDALNMRLATSVVQQLPEGQGGDDWRGE